MECKSEHCIPAGWGCVPKGHTAKQPSADTEFKDPYLSQLLSVPLPPSGKPSKHCSGQVRADVGVALSVPAPHVDSRHASRSSKLFFAAAAKFMLPATSCSTPSRAYTDTDAIGPPCPCYYTRSHPCTCIAQCWLLMSH